MSRPSSESLKERLKLRVFIIEVYRLLTCNSDRREERL